MWIIISLNLLSNNFNFFVLTWLVFIYPILNRRNISLKTKYLQQKEVVFTQTIYNIYPFVPNVYFSAFKAISNKIYFRQKNKNNIYFLSKYYNFNKNKFIVK